MKEKLSLEKIKEIREDLVGTNFEYIIDYIDKGILSLYNTGNFLLLFKTPYGTRRNLEKDLANKIDRIIKEDKININIPIKKDLGINEEISKKIFQVYKKMHEKFDIPYVHLLSSNYLDKN